MQNDLKQDFEKAAYCELTLRPHRSLDAKGLKIFYTGLAVITAAANLFFLTKTPAPASFVYAMAYNITFGALAFCINLTVKSGKEYEKITLRDDKLEIRHYKPGFEKEHVRSLSPFMLRVETEYDTYGRCEKVLLRSQGGQTEIGSFLTPDDKLYFANKLKEALKEHSLPEHLRSESRQEPRP